MKNLNLLFLFLFLSHFLISQQQVSIRINNADDDLEEYLPGLNQTKTPGAIDIGSSDLELGMETKDNIDPQLIGLRFNSVTIPKGALITKAYIQFTVDNTNKNTDPCNLNIYIEESSNAAAFNSSESFNLSKRKKITEFISWNIKNGSWETIGLMDKDQASPDISSLVQKVIDLEGWNSGNSLAIYITGSGLREAESFDGAPHMAPLLIIEYISSLSFNQRVESAEDDLEEYLPGPNQTKTVGSVDIGSSDLELGMETKDNIDPQYVGIRFNKIAIPQGSKIKSAYIQFTVDNTNKNTDPCNLNIYLEDALNSSAFNTSETFVLTKRKVLQDSVSWNIASSTWNVIGEKSLQQRTPDLSKLLQSLVDQKQWNNGNSMSFFIKGNGLREAEAYDGSPADAPQLIIEYIPLAKSEFTILTAEDDLEEYLPGPNQTKTVGNMDVGSSDLELGMETKDNIDPQLVGMRFDKIKLPKGTIVSNAYIQFTVDNINKNTDPCDLTIWAEDISQSSIFNSNEPFNLSKRKLLNDSVLWNIAKSTWNTIGEKSNEQQSPNISSLINQILSKSDWNEGNAISIFIKGTGLREAESYDGSPADAPKLVLEYLQSKKPPIAVGSFPVARKSEWSYFDSSYVPAPNWNTESYLDLNWNYGAGPLGFGDPFIVTKIGFGGNENNKNSTSYFRKKIQIDDVSKLNEFIEFNLKADDGAVVYVNGSEVIRYNMPSGNINYDTKAINRILGIDELPYFVYDIPKSNFKNGINLIAVEIHQWGGVSSDLSFDLEIKNQTGISNPTDLGCTTGNENHISCFTSLIPKEQDELLRIPSSHKFQYLVGARDSYVGMAGSFGTNFDFTGYVPIERSSTRGYVSINHETAPGGVSIIEVNFNSIKKIWESVSSGSVDFSPVVLTAANCSGTVTPWNTIITCEETTGFDTLDINKDGYSDLGWAIEIDPKTRLIKNYGKGPEKLWALGRMSHENVVILSDKKTLYQGEDEGDGSVYKFIADKEEDMSQGKLYVLKVSSPFVNGEPTGTEGVWLEVPNTTIKERNEVKKWAIANGATTFAGVEDVEVNPINGQIFFAVKGVGRVYKFQDNGSTISKFETYVGGKSYRVNSDGRVVSESWGLGNDNLTFDDLGNLWVLQDGGSNFIWVIRPDHTQLKPKIEIFMHTPIGSEPTGMTFTPDFKYMFLSIQEPSSGNNITIKDASNKDIKFNKSTCLVISRNDNLGVGTNSFVDDQKVSLSIMPNPFTQHSNIKLTIEENVDFSFTIRNIEGKLVYNSNNIKLDSGTHNLSFSLENDGLYILTARINGKPLSLKLINQR